MLQSKLSEMLKRGDVVEVKSAREIFDTLDKNGTIDALPFMQEMIKYCGHRFVVDKRAEKICDTIKSYSSRRLRNALLLEDMRCDGSAHDGCQADCRIFWKESWLRKVPNNNNPSILQAPNSGSPELLDVTSRFACKKTMIEGHPEYIYRCQATELYNATTPLRAFDPRPYLREFTTGNVTLGHFLRGTIHAYVENFRAKYRSIMRRILRRNQESWIHLPGTRTGPVSKNLLDLQPGDLIQVKTKMEIAATLTPKGRDRGLWFDREMLPFCGGTYRVRQRVTRFINDRTGRMIEMKNDCVTLEGVVCSGYHCDYRHFCPRAIYPFWRENWLRRANEPDLSSGK
jgi:hypothetical protein